MVHFLVLATLAVSSVDAVPTPVEWHADYGKALAATRTDDRPLLVVLDDPSDTQAAAEDEQMKTVGLTSYRLCRIDSSTEYGQKVAEVFNAQQFPFTAIIDKTGSVVLHKKQGKLTDAEWNVVLSAYKTGERLQPVYHTTAYRGETIVEGKNVSGTFSFPAATTAVQSPSYCPSCQKNAQRGF